MVIVCPIVFSVSFVAAIIWLAITKYYKLLLFFKKAPKITELPIVTSTGQIVNSVEELNIHLEFLQNQLEDKEKELELSKGKITSTEDNLKTINDTASEVKKYYLKLKSEITKNEKEYDDLKGQIEDYKMRQIRLREEVTQNVKYYTNMLSTIDSRTGVSGNEDYEVVGKVPLRNNSQMITDKYSVM